MLSLLIWIIQHAQQVPLDEVDEHQVVTHPLELLGYDQQQQSRHEGIGSVQAIQAVYSKSSDLEAPNHTQLCVVWEARKLIKNVIILHDLGVELLTTLTCVRVIKIIVLDLTRRNQFVDVLLQGVSERLKGVYTTKIYLLMRFTWRHEVHHQDEPITLGGVINVLHKCRSSQLEWPREFDEVGDTYIYKWWSWYPPASRRWGHCRVDTHN